MSVPFNTIPAGNGIRVPLFYAEVDNSQANVVSPGNRTLLLGQKLSGGSATNNVPVLVGSEAQAITLFGRGSMLARMFQVYRLSDPVGEVWAIPVPDDGSGVTATGTIVVTGPATESGTIALYIAGQKVNVTVISGDSATTVGGSIAAAINAATDLPVTAANSSGTVTLTCRWKGTTGNDITIFHSFRGLASGEKLPAGIALAITAMASGTTAPSLTTAITAMGDDPYEFVIHPYSDTTSMDALKTEMGDSSGRWSWSRMLFGHAYTADRDTLNNLVTLGAARNDQHNTIAGVDADTPAPIWEYAAAYGARNAVFISADPARPTQTGELTGILAPREGKRFIFTERNSLLNYGIATSKVIGGVLQVERAITTYQVNASGQDDVSYLDSETLHQLAYIIRRLQSAITSKYARHKLANDGTRFGAGAAVVTPAVIRAELAGQYLEMERAGIVENAAAFAAALVVERDDTNPNRVNVLYPPDLVNQLRVFAVNTQFRLQYPA